EWREMTTALVEAPAGPVELRLQGAPPVTLDLPAGLEERERLVTALTPPIPPVIGEVEGDSPAERAGLHPGDRVVEAAGKPVADWTELVAAIQGSPGRPLPLVVERGGRRVTLQAMPAAVTPERPRQRGAPAKVGRLGAGYQEIELERRSVGVLRAVQIGFDDTAFTTRYLLKTLKQLVTGELSARNMGGLLTIGKASGESARLGLERFLSFLALFSVNLAVLNLLPIPILDGGHLMFLAAEAVRGRPLSIETRIRLSQVGLVIVVALMLWANGNDVVRWLEQTFGG
ncbi:MAG TPA: RIP metalloprotease RseP, partial [Longimicrobiaceae bacterium]|nr:RIP metalloprotease RseP [Longimicrobiaceae bacterium]